VLASPVRAQQNPFKLPKMNLKGQVEYTLSGDQTGTASAACDGDRVMRRSTGKAKMMGKETELSQWTLMTPDSIYTADLIKKRGSQAPNMLPLMAKAYDDLDGTGKQRFHSNLKDMAGMFSQMFGANPLGAIGDKKGELTIAGEVCEDHQFGGFEVCTMKRGPRVSLKTSGDLLCFRFDETATSVSLSAPAGSAFEKPAGVVFQPFQQNADSMAKLYVGYLASQQLTDSLAAATAELEKAKAEAPPANKDKPQELTKEQKEEMRAACDLIKNYDFNKVLGDIGHAMVEGMKQAAVNGAKQSATNKVKGLFKKPRIP
jgi:hypothetical protein